MVLLTKIENILSENQDFIKQLMNKKKQPDFVGLLFNFKII